MVNEPKPLFEIQRSKLSFRPWWWLKMAGFGWKAIWSCIVKKKGLEFA
jgi:hypothetical protein